MLSAIDSLRSLYLHTLRSLYGKGGSLHRRRAARWRGSGCAICISITFTCGKLKGTHSMPNYHGREGPGATGVAAICLIHCLTGHYLRSSSTQNGSMSSSVHSNGYLEGNSPNSSQLSSEGGGGGTAPDATLISRTQKQHTTQQVRGADGGRGRTMGGSRELWTVIATSQPRVQIHASQGNAIVKLRELPTNMPRLI